MEWMFETVTPTDGTQRHEPGEAKEQGATLLSRT